MTESEKVWLKNTFLLEYFDTPVALKGDGLSAYYEAERILNGWDEIKRRGCKCELGTLKSSVSTKLKKFLEDELYKEVPTKEE